MRQLPVFQTVTFALNGGLTMAELQMGIEILEHARRRARTVARLWATSVL